jgi:hypothetical protein
MGVFSADGCCDEASGAGADYAVRSVASTTVAAGASGAISFTGGDISVTTTEVNETIRIWFAIRRDNTSATGNGTYEITIAGTPVSPGFRGSGDIDQTVPGVWLATIAAAGTYAVGIKLTATTGNETADAGTMMVSGSNVS